MQIYHTGQTSENNISFSIVTIMLWTILPLASGEFVYFWRKIQTQHLGQYVLPFPVYRQLCQRQRGRKPDLCLQEVLAAPGMGR